MSAPGVGEFIAWIRSLIVKARTRAEKEAAATAVPDCLNADHDPKDVLAAADMHEALLDAPRVDPDWPTCATDACVGRQIEGFEHCLVRQPHFGDLGWSGG